MQTRAVARRLESHYYCGGWQSHGDPIDELVGTILSQHTSDTNTARAFQSLRTRFPTWDEVVTAETGDVAGAIRSGGLANIKAPRIQAVLREVKQRYGSFELSSLASKSVGEARRELVSLTGVGPKTASCVLLFSIGLPAMPVDTHVHRVARRIGLIADNVTAEAAHERLEHQLGDNRDEVYAFHLNLIAHGRRVCLARRPYCERCVLTDCCDYFTHAHATDSAPD